MKKALASILAILYLTSALGATIHLHYCMDKLINWSLFKDDGDKCGKCGMEKDGGCCKDEQKFVKNSVDQKVTESSFEAIKFLLVTPLVAGFNISEFNSSRVDEYPVSHAPPIRGSKIHIRNCLFRI